MKKISLITTTKDRPEMLINCALSVECQSYKPFEWIVVIDGKNQEQKYYEAMDCLKTMPFVRIIRAGNLGRNRALRMAHDLVQGDYIAWLDDDDHLHHSCLAKFNQAPEAGLIYCNYYQVKKDRILDAPYANKPYSYKNFLRFGMILHLVLYSKRLYKLVGGIDPEIEACIDHELYARILKETEPYKIDDHLYYYRMYGERMSTVLKDEQKVQFALIQQNYG